MTWGECVTSQHYLETGAFTGTGGRLISNLDSWLDSCGSPIFQEVAVAFNPNRVGWVLCFWICMLHSAVLCQTRTISPVIHQTVSKNASYILKPHPDFIVPGLIFLFLTKSPFSLKLMWLSLTLDLLQTQWYIQRMDRQRAVTSFLPFSPFYTHTCLLLLILLLQLPNPAHSFFQWPGTKSQTWPLLSPALSLPGSHGVLQVVASLPVSRMSQPFHFQHKSHPATHRLAQPPVQTIRTPSCHRDGVLFLKHHPTHVKS